MLKISFFGSGLALARGPIDKGRPGPGPGPKKFAGPTKKKARNNTKPLTHINPA